MAGRQLAAGDRHSGLGTPYGRTRTRRASRSAKTPSARPWPPQRGNRKVGAARKSVCPKAGNWAAGMVRGYRGGVAARAEATLLVVFRTGPEPAHAMSAPALVERVRIDARAATSRRSQPRGYGAAIRRFKFLIAVVAPAARSTAQASVTGSR